MKKTIDFTAFLNVENELEIKMGKVISATPVKKSSGFELLVDFKTEKRSVFTNLNGTISAEDLTGLTLPFITNLEPTTIKGILSEAMILLPKDSFNEVSFTELKMGDTIL